MIVKLFLKNIPLLVIIGLFGFSVWSFGEIKYQKAEKNRFEENYKNIRLLDSVKTAFLQFRTTKEIQDFVNENEDLKAMLIRERIKAKRIKTIITQKQKYIDSLFRKTDVSGMVEKIRKDIPYIQKWKDSTSCLSVNGVLSYANDSLTVGVTNRRFSNTINIVGHLKRKKWSFLGIKTRLFGKMQTKVTASSKCGEAKTVIIQKNSK